MTDLLELAARCEAATGPDRKLDAAIEWAVFGPSGGAAIITSHWTSDLNAALELVPSPAEYPDSKTFLLDCATQTSVYAQPVAYAWSDTGKHMGKARTPALALCAAALRARAKTP